MQYALMLEPQQGLSYAEQREIALLAESVGFEALFRSDHYASFPGPAGEPTTDAWAVLAGLARDTSRIRLGALVSPVTFRQPGNFAKVLATVQEMSDGRVELGLGAGWNDDEHRQYGFPFPPIDARAEMLEEQLEIVRGLWTQPDGWSFRGRHYTIEDSRFHPRPPFPRVLVGGDGKPRSMRIGARFADEYNITGTGPAEIGAKYTSLAEACRAIGRDPATLTRSAMVTTLIGRDQAAVERRVDGLMGRTGARGTSDAKEWLDARRSRWILGTYDEARETIRRFADAGVQRLMLQDLYPWDLDMVREMGEELVSRG